MVSAGKLCMSSTSTYIHYSPVSQKHLARVDLVEKVRVVPMPAYCAVMLTGRDTFSMINMLPIEERYVRTVFGIKCR